MVENEKSWIEEEVCAMETMEAIPVNNSGEESTYTGVSINALLDMAGVKDGASSVVFIADDGSEGQVALEELRSCADCMYRFAIGVSLAS